MIKIEKGLYFAYGSNMDKIQMAERCRTAKVVGTVQLEGYNLAFRDNGGGYGVATILPGPGCVEGVLWSLGKADERNLDHYEGYPRLYGKEAVKVTTQDGEIHEVMAYTMNPPQCQIPAFPSKAYLEGILRGCRQNGISNDAVLEAFHRAVEELYREPEEPVRKRPAPTKNREER